MMKKTTFLAASVLAAMTFTSSIALAESPLTGNINVTNNYLWRGVTQTADQAAVQGGIDYAHDSGFYLGGWASNVTFTTPTGYELDVYAGYGFDAGPVGLDLGYIAYVYPVGVGEDDFAEVYLNASWEMLTAGAAYTVSKEASSDNKNDIYLYIGAEFEVKKDLTLGLLVGNYNYDEPTASDYTHFMVSLSKNDFTAAFEKNDLPTTTGGEDDYRLTVSWGKEFDL